MLELPFYFCVIEGGHLYGQSNETEVRKHFVKVASWDMTLYSSGWMCDPTLPEGKVFVPDVDIAHSCKEFPSEREALEFIKSWWNTQSNHESV